MEKYKQYIEDQLTAIENRIDNINLEIRKLEKEEKICIYGAGDHTVSLFEYTCALESNITHVVDIGKVGEKFYGYLIKHPESIKSMNVDCIIISSFRFQEEIFNYLVNDLKYKGRIMKIYKDGDKFPFYTIRNILSPSKEIISNGKSFIKKIDWIFKDLQQYMKLNPKEQIPEEKLLFCYKDKLETTPVDFYYFYQDTWLSKKIFEGRPSHHVDVGSTALLVGILSQYTKVTSVDIRPLNVKLDGLNAIKGSITDMPFDDESIESLSTMCVLEHIGLGRYGDEVAEDGIKIAAKELTRTIKSKGNLYISVPIDKNNYTQFNAHRVFTIEILENYFSSFDIVDSIFIDDNNILTIDEYVFNNTCEYVVGCFHMIKK